MPRFPAMAAMMAVYGLTSLLPASANDSWNIYLTLALHWRNPIVLEIADDSGFRRILAESLMLPSHCFRWPSVHANSSG